MFGKSVLETTLTPDNLDKHTNEGGRERERERTSASICVWVRVNNRAGKPYRRGRLSTVDLHVRNSLDQLFLILQTLLISLQN